MSIPPLQNVRWNLKLTWGIGNITKWLQHTCELVADNCHCTLKWRFKGWTFDSVYLTELMLNVPSTLKICGRRGRRRGPNYSEPSLKISLYLFAHGPPSPSWIFWTSKNRHCTVFECKMNVMCWHAGHCQRKCSSLITFRPKIKHKLSNFKGKFLSVLYETSTQNCYFFPHIIISRLLKIIWANLNALLLLFI
jgi:hypothetical protein